MKKKAAALLLILAMCIMTGACDFLDRFKESRESEVTESENVYIPPEGEQKITRILSGVSEGRLWVSYGEDESYGMALIDTDGNVLYAYDRINEFTDMHKGIAFITRPDRKDQKHEYICLIDKNGKEIKAVQGNENASYSLIAAEGGKCIIYEYYANIHKMHIMDSKGNFVFTRELESDPSLRLGFIKSKAADGLYAVQYSNNGRSKLIMVRIDKPSILCTEPENETVIFNFGNIINYSSDDKGIYYQVLPIKHYANDEALAEALKKVTESEHFYISGNFRNIYDVTSGKKGAVLPYVFRDGEVLDNIYVHDGYAYITMINQSATKRLFTVSDMTGTPLYDPLEEDFSDPVLDMDNGNLIVDGGLILTTGEKVSFKNLPSGFKFSRDHYFGKNSIFLLQNEHTGAYSNGLMFDGAICEGYYIAGSTVDNVISSFGTIDGSKTVSTINFKK